MNSYIATISGWKGVRHQTVRAENPEQARILAGMRMRFRAGDSIMSIEPRKPRKEKRDDN